MLESDKDNKKCHNHNHNHDHKHKHKHKHKKCEEMNENTFNYMTVTASNDPNNNQLLIYDIDGCLLQSILTNGKGGVSGNAGGIARYKKLIAVVNYGSNNVSLFEYHHGAFELIQIIPANSAPVSVAFGHSHIYILGATTVESHLIHHRKIVDDIPDGVANLLLADKSSAQVGVLKDQLVITEKGTGTSTPPTGLIEVVSLENGAIKGSVTSIQLPVSPNNLTPFGLAVKDNKAYVTIAHSYLISVLVDNILANVICSNTQIAPCWATVLDRWLFTSNTGSKSISRYEIKGDTIVSDVPSLASGLGATTDIDAKCHILSVLNTQSDGIYLSQFKVNDQGDLSLISSINTGYSTTNGVAIYY